MFTEVFLSLSLLIGISTNNTSTAETTLTNTVTNEKLVIKVSATWEDWPRRVSVRGRDLYRKLLPTIPVVLAATCRARSTSYFDVLDGDKNPLTGYNRGVRIYYAAVDCKQYINGKMYRIEGICPQAGRIYATSVIQIN